MKKIHSVSSEGLSSINIEFVTGTDIDDVLQKVRDRVDETKKELPADLEEDPSVFEVNFSELPISCIFPVRVLRYCLPERNCRRSQG